MATQLEKEQAQQIREADQRNFVSGLAEAVRRRASEDGNSSMFIQKFALCVLWWFLYSTSVPFPDVNPAQRLFDALRREIESFGRTASERKCLLQLLFGDLKTGILHEVMLAYLKEAKEKPEELFGPELERLRELQKGMSLADCLELRLEGLRNVMSRR